jgi:N-acetylglucosaminyldiphosphoundecaprenol N-acetyl-beta-D-mannosaminyltransferase
MKNYMLGYVLDCSSVAGCVDEVFTSLQAPTGKGSTCAWLACLNPHSYVVALNDSIFSQALNDADWLLPDGAGIVLASRLLRGKVQERVTGSDIFVGLHSRMNNAGCMSVFFLGSTEHNLDLIRKRMTQDYPNICIAGTYSPPFKPNYSENELEEMIKVINAAKPDVLWVGMTAPKQEKWIFENRARLNVRFAGAIGAVFDFYTGSVKRSHPVFQRLGLEWLPRLIQQPKRLWRRMLVSAPIFLWHVLREKFRR